MLIPGAKAPKLVTRDMLREMEPGSVMVDVFELFADIVFRRHQGLDVLGHHVGQVGDYGLGIANIGLANAKMICKEFKNDVEAMLQATEEDLSAISGVGGVIAGAFVSYFRQEKHLESFRNLLITVGPFW